MKLSTEKTKFAEEELAGYLAKKWGVTFLRASSDFAPVDYYCIRLSDKVSKCVAVCELKIRAKKINKLFIDEEKWLNVVRVANELFCFAYFIVKYTDVNEIYYYRLDDYYPLGVSRITGRRDRNLPEDVEKVYEIPFYCCEKVC